MGSLLMTKPVNIKQELAFFPFIYPEISPENKQDFYRQAPGVILQANLSLRVACLMMNTDF